MALCLPVYAQLSKSDSLVRLSHDICFNDTNRQNKTIFLERFPKDYKELKSTYSGKESIEAYLQLLYHLFF